jgi:hypothetical protein
VMQCTLLEHIVQFIAGRRLARSSKASIYPMRERNNVRSDT